MGTAKKNGFEPHLFCGFFLAPYSHMRLPPKAAVLRADDPPGRPVGLGGRDLACLEKGRIATKLCLVGPKRALLLCNRVLNARPHTIFLRVPV
jgi:hypothetical protein